MLDKLTTESRNPEAEQIDYLSTLDLVRFINNEDEKIAAAVRTQDHVIAQAIDAIVERTGDGGRLLYVGAGTSGRLGVLDASECPPTFNTDPELVVGIIAGGKDALVRSSEGAEDIAGLATKDLENHNVNRRDVVVGIASSGRTHYVLEAITHAKSIGCLTVSISCNEAGKVNSLSDLAIVPIVGPEVVSGSTRMKAGTATKMILNMLTTGTMIRSGKTYGDLMVDLRATNRKLQDRAVRILQSLTKLERIEAELLLEQSDGEVKTAIVMHHKKCTAERARELLSHANGFLRRVLET